MGAMFCWPLRRSTPFLIHRGVGTPGRWIPGHNPHWPALPWSASIQPVFLPGSRLVAMDYPSRLPRVILNPPAHSPRGDRSRGGPDPWPPGKRHEDRIAAMPHRTFGHTAIPAGGDSGLASTTEQDHRGLDRPCQPTAAPGGEDRNRAGPGSVGCPVARGRACRSPEGGDGASQDSPVVFSRLPGGAPHGGVPPGRGLVAAEPARSRHGQGGRVHGYSRLQQGNGADAQLHAARVGPRFP